MQLKKKFIKNGSEIEILFREPKISDAKATMKFINSLVIEGAFIARTRPSTLLEQKRNLKDIIKAIKENKEVRYFAFHNNKVIGFCGVSKEIYDVQTHLGNTGIMLEKNYRGIGLGKVIMNIVMEEAKRTLKMEIIKLTVFDTNKSAIKFYKNLGFLESGRIPRAFKQGNKYHAEITMYKELK